MNMHQRFEFSAAASIDTLVASKLSTAHDTLLVSGVYLGSSLGALRADDAKIFAVPLTPDAEAHETLNAIAMWLRKGNGLDQRAIHDDRRQDYNITFFRAYPDSDCLSVVQDFYLEDFIFAHNHPEQVRHVDDLLRMLDRDKLAEAMLASLTDDFGLKPRDDAPQFWRRDMRVCSHPDHPWAAPEKVVAPVPAIA